MAGGPRPAVLGHMRPGFGFWLSYARDIEAREFGPVDTQVAGHVRLALGLFDRLELAGGLPILLLRSDDPALASEGISDGYASAKLRLVGADAGRGLSLGLRGGVSLPVEGDAPFIRDVRTPLTAGLMASWAGRTISAGLDVGLTFDRDARIGREHGGDTATAALGVEMFVVPEKLSVAVEGEVRAPRTGEDRVGAEARGGLRAFLDDASILAISAGAGMFDGVGTPGLRLLVGWRYEPRSADPDGDGILDAFDACPLQAEDRDGFRDADGCPDDDNDADGVDDAVDDCPELAEDRNGYRDNDGCPDDADDADHDGVHDLADRCPADPEDRDEHDDQDGCPDDDDDGADVEDRADRCPHEREDVDGHLDADGCPDPDNDDDGFLDREDACPSKPEDYDGVEDGDGCPEAAAARAPKPAAPTGAAARTTPAPATPGPATPGPTGPAAVLHDDRIELVEPVRFRTDAAELDPDYLYVVDQVAALILSDPGIKAVHIEGHTDEAGPHAWNLDLSQRRAETVRAHLMVRGVQAAKLTAKGFGPDRPVADNFTAEGRRLNRRVDFLVER